jgi:ubiquinone/menaquinone biosynthesis C-methylase UbiE
MSAHYDTYDYPNYWIGRDYEHGSELIALKALLNKIPKIGTIVEIGAGFGRLTPSYYYRAKKAILTDPSSKLLKIARDEFSDKKNIHILQAGIETLPAKLRSGAADLVIMVRVLHHITDLKGALLTVNKILLPGGYFILEFPNKMHLKATLRQLFKGNLTFRFDIFTADKSSAKSKRQKKISFLNYHPDMIFEKLQENGFEIIEKRSVSNIRSTFIKNLLPCATLLTIEEFVQKPFSLINFGPSVFVLARKRG